jgi:hypothetical protein
VPLAKLSFARRQAHGFAPIYKTQHNKAASVREKISSAERQKLSSAPRRGRPAIPALSRILAK